jgi:hypothetical protein
MFRGHCQPNVPGDLGFYDLRLPETRLAQAELARHYGVTAFCYWHYWFAGRRVLDRPFREVLKSGEPDFPFCLGWANQTWSGIWHGDPDRILIEQTYPGDADHSRHFYALLEAFADDRYFKVDGRPLFYVYQPQRLPEARRVTDLWRELAHREGLKGLHLVGQVHGASSAWMPTDHGFDAAVLAGLPLLLMETSWRMPRRRVLSILRRWRRRPTVYEYRNVLSTLMAELPSGGLSYPCVLPNWDNTPRSRENGLVLQNSTPEYFRLLLRNAFDRVADRAPAQRLVFIKSWNEWAEGNYLEPDRRFGHQYLEAVRIELDRFQAERERSLRVPHHA